MKQKNPIFMIATLILAIILLFGLVACDKNSSKLDDSSSQTSIILNEDPNPVPDNELIEISSFLIFDYYSPDNYGTDTFLLQNFPNGFYVANIGHVENMKNWAIDSFEEMEQSVIDLGRDYYILQEYNDLFKNVKLTIPEEYNGLPVGMFISYEGWHPVYGLRSLHISKNIFHLSLGSACLNKITLDSQNTYLRVENNCVIANQDAGMYHKKDELVFANGFIKEIPSSVKLIGPRVFVAALGIDNIVLPSALAISGDIQICLCPSLKTITIPSTPNIVENHGEHTISIHTNRRLAKIIFGGTKAQWESLVSSQNISISNTSSYTIQCTDGDIVVQ